MTPEKLLHAMLPIDARRMLEDPNSFITLWVDKGYDAAKFIKEMKITP